MQRIGLFGGPVIAVVVYLLLAPSVAVGAGLSHAGHVTTALATLMAVWWLTEAIPVTATALLPIPLFPLFGVASTKAATAPFAHNLIFLFLGGFLLALAMQRWQLHRRIALLVLAALGNRTEWLVAGFMGLTAWFSMWVSNTATVVMMLPIAISVIDLATRNAKANNQPVPVNFPICLMLGLAYAATIGGTGTLIGTPPNALLAAYVNTAYGVTIGFQQWMRFGLPVVILLLPLCWWMLTRWLYPIRTEQIAGSRALFAEELRGLGPMQRAEWIVTITFLCTALAWVFRPLVAHLLPSIDDTVIAMSGALLLFLIPAGGGTNKRVLDWSVASELPWGVLLLFGGGLSLASAMTANGVSTFIGQQIAGIGAVHPLILIFVVCLVVKILTEITSNTATAAAFLPVLGAIAVGFGVNPYLLLIPAAVGASCAFMLPVATPPNALVFASGRVTIAQMSRAGLWLNLAAVIIITLLTYFAAERFFGTAIASSGHL